MTMTLTHRVLPVIHHVSTEVSVAQADLAMRCGADGVFLISHDGRNMDLFKPAHIIRSRYPMAKLGINLLGVSAVAALDEVASANLNMLWTDNPDVSSLGPGKVAKAIAFFLSLHSGFEFFGSVAFKYQAVEPDPAGAAVEAMKLGMIATTSGPATGNAPTVEKLAAMRAAIGPTARVAVASGMTVENVGSFLPYVTDFLVATGVSSDIHHFDETLLRQFVEAVRVETVSR